MSGECFIIIWSHTFTMACLWFQFDSIILWKCLFNRTKLAIYLYQWISFENNMLCRCSYVAIQPIVCTVAFTCNVSTKLVLLSHISNTQSQINILHVFWYIATKSFWLSSYLTTNSCTRCGLMAFVVLCELGSNLIWRVYFRGSQ